MNTISRLGLCRFRPGMMTLRSPVLRGAPQAFLFTQKQKSNKKFVSNNKADGVDGSSYVVHHNSNASYLYSSVGITGVVLVPTLASVAAIIAENWHKFPDVLQSIEEPVLPSIIMGTFGVVLMASLVRFYNRAVGRVYYNENKETFTLVPLWTLPRKANVVFTPHDVEWLSKTAMMKEFSGNMTIKGRAYYISAADFKTPSLYQTMTAAANRKL